MVKSTLLTEDEAKRIPRGNKKQALCLQVGKMQPCRMITHVTLPINLQYCVWFEIASVDQSVGDGNSITEYHSLVKNL